MKNLQAKSFSSDERKKGFDFEKFEEERKKERAKFRSEKKQYTHQEADGESSNTNQQKSQSSQQQGSIIQLPPMIARDLVLMNLPKYVSREELKRQYHKLAKQYHPDILSSKASGMIPHSKKLQMEEKFKEFNQAYERLAVWVQERDSVLDEDLKHNRRPGVQVNTEDGSVTYTIGKLTIEGKRSALDKQQLLEQMIEDEFKLKEPRNLKRNLIVMWMCIGTYVFYKEFKQYYSRMSQPKEGVVYEKYFKIWTHKAESSQQQ